MAPDVDSRFRGNDVFRVVSARPSFPRKRESTGYALFQMLRVRLEDFEVHFDERLVAPIRLEKQAGSRHG